MLLDYGTQLSPYPIRLSIGVLKKPRLSDIAQISFSVFGTYEFLLRCTPKDYFTKLLRENGGVEQWKAMPEDKKASLTMYELIRLDEKLRAAYTEIFDFFFEENVVFREDFFILFEGDLEQSSEVSIKSVHGIISEGNFDQIIDVLKQVCCLHVKADESAEDMNFKNDLARKLFEKMQAALKKKEEEKEAKADKDLSLPNIISSVSARHPSINLSNIWDLTLYQLLDTFRRMQGNEVYNIDSTRVAVWGDEKKVFDPTLWYKNNYDK